MSLRCSREFISTSKNDVEEDDDRLACLLNNKLNVRLSNCETLKRSHLFLYKEVLEKGALIRFGEDFLVDHGVEFGLQLSMLDF